MSERMFRRLTPRMWVELGELARLLDTSVGYTWVRNLATINALHRRGLIAPAQEPRDTPYTAHLIVRRRRYYQITPLGREALAWSEKQKEQS